MISRELLETEDPRQLRRDDRPVPGARLYLLVLDGNSSALSSLPRGGSLLVGRAAGADIPLQDTSVSRQHARIVVADGQVSIVDLGSHNGIRVNGERVSGSRPLQSEDVVTLGNTTLVLHCGEPPLPARAALEAPALRLRLAEELERVRIYERAVSVLSVVTEGATAPPAELARLAGGVLRPMDLIGHNGPTLQVVLPELAGEEAEATAQELLECFAPVASQARAGLATAPQDGLSPDALMAAASAAALAALPGEVRASGPELHRLQLGERSMVVADAAMVRLYELLRRLAASPIPVLVHGETGSGKENAAWAIHHWSPRAGHPFVALNCSALPDTLVESELFGCERGAFSGADRPRAGLFERASGGTLFLDEVAELTLATQAKLLRALDQQRITRLGDSRERPVDLRVVAATHKTLAEEVKAGRFREDLYFRLAAAVVVLPPLRERPRELPLLANAFLAEVRARTGRPMQFSAAAMTALCAHPWPGNVRELKNTVERAVATAPGPIIEPSHLFDGLARTHPEPAPSAPPEEAAAPAQGSPRAFQPLA
ncbi:MAG TPA: sigma 54-interacting transcriptional regulator, partial [Longimicrobium sp.]|nr:sigma 54-interacting transcriptional regulator [Longimicrobium sp.]